MNNLLYDEHPLIVNPTLATIIGLNEAIVLQQVHYWIEIEKKSKDEEIIEKHYHDDKWWIYNTFEQWQKQFPFWSLSTIKRIISNLKEMNLLLTDNFNKFGYDRTKWYTIDYEVLESLAVSHSVKLTQSKVSDRNNGKCQDDTSNTIEYSENTSKEYINNKMVQHSTNVCTPSFSFEIMKKQIQKVCESKFPCLNPKEIIDIFEYYCNSFEEKTGKTHNKLRNEYIERIIAFITEHDYSYENYIDMIDKHFKTSYKEGTDYNMIHFFTEGIIKNRCFEACY